MVYDFDQVIERANTNSLKWHDKHYIGRDILPMWVADMDFSVPQQVVDELVKRAKHPIYGYSEPMDDYYLALTDWLQKRHNWPVEREWICFSPGIVPALNWLVKALARPGQKVMLQSPVYPPFFKAIEAGGCQLVNNQLLYEDGCYRMDFEDMEQKLQSGVKVFFLCSPHNPVGRVWTKEELAKVGQLCLQYGVTVVSDEIHFDLIYPGNKHKVFASLDTEFSANSIVCTASSKTFNMAGLQVSNLIIPNPELRKAFTGEMQKNGIGRPNTFGMVAMQAAYRYGEDWLEQVLEYLQGNLDYLASFAASRPWLKLVKPQGTYLAWLDFSKLGMGTKELNKFLLTKAKVGLNDGSSFGPGGEGFQRLNLACPRSILAQGLDRIAQAVDQN